MNLLTPNGHIVTTIADRNYIIDTGSPISFNYEGIPSLELGGQKFDFSRLAACSRKELIGLTGMDIAGLIGTDILAETGLTIDLEGKTLAFSADSDNIDSNEYVCLSFDYFLGKTMGRYLVTEDVFMGRQLRNAIIDTGAPVPYVSAGLTALFEHTGELYEDFSPSYGILKGEYLRGELILKHHPQQVSRSVKVGLMPELLDMFGLFDAILGVTAFTDKKIIFDFNKMKLLVKI